MAIVPSSTRQTPIIKLIRPFQEFAARETSGGVLLLACTIAALVWANSPWAKSYAALWHIPLTVGLGSFSLSHDLHFWVNDGLMAIFSSWSGWRSSGSCWQGSWLLPVKPLCLFWPPSAAWLFRHFSTAP